MKLPDFINNNVFNRVRKSMDIEDGYVSKFDVDINFSKITLESAKFEQLERGIGLDIRLDDLEIGPDNTIQYDNKNVVLYIRDQYSYKGQYKYHVSWCKTLREMRDNNKLDRYVISRRTDGSFYVNILDKHSQNMVEENVVSELHVCKNCLNQIDYRGYSRSSRQRKDSIYEGFLLQEFLETYDTRFRQLPKYTEFTAPANKYPKNWNEISRAYRAYKQWTCEECGTYCGNNKGYLDVHHIDSNKSNVNYSNLKALCKDCHSEEYGHGHYKNLLKAR